ncbi:hypothetical protein, partial [Paraclostridium sordellii]|uniref:hypothetical protein n=1 Tax=Paraclostridium sordellii TaxID=1505 RepID=UPI001F062AE1
FAERLARGNDDKGALAPPTSLQCSIFNKLRFLKLTDCDSMRLILFLIIYKMITLYNKTYLLST